MKRRPPSTPAWLPASLEHLRAAGLVESVGHDDDTGEGRVVFTPAYHALLLAGRLPFLEEGFLEAWQTGDPRVVRTWVEREASRVISGQPAAGEEDPR
jgi:hypothetical protein